MLPLYNHTANTDSKRIIILGESNHSCLLSNLSPLEASQFTISQFRFENKEYILEFVSVPHSRHPRTHDLYYRKAQGLILLYESSSELSYKKCKRWLQEFKQGRILSELDPNVPTLVIGNGKMDTDKQCPIAKETNGFSITADLSHSTQALMEFQPILNAFYSLIVKY